MSLISDEVGHCEERDGRITTTTVEPAGVERITRLTELRDFAGEPLTTTRTGAVLAGDWDSAEGVSVTTVATAAGEGNGVGVRSVSVDVAGGSDAGGDAVNSTLTSRESAEFGVEPVSHAP